MARLPQPGGDTGNWGTILNDFLDQAHESNGSLSDNSVTAPTLTQDAVTTNIIAAATISEDKLSSSVRTKLNTPPNNAVSSLNSKTGAVTIVADDIDDTASNHRFATAAQIAKVTDAASGATANDSDSILRARANHTGAQPLATVVGLDTSLADKPNIVIVSTGQEARPTESTVVLWIGGASEPTNMGAQDLWFTPGSPPDLTPPSVPTGLVASGVVGSTFTVSWTASTDAVGVTGYRVFVDGVSYATPSGTTQFIDNLTPDTTYQITVQARDAAGNWSAESAPLSVLTGNASTEYSVFGAGSPPWIPGYYNDDGQPIMLANIFRTYGTDVADSGVNRCVGGRIWVPEPAVGQQIIMRAWKQDIGTINSPSDPTPYTASITPTQTGWAEVHWPTPMPLTQVLDPEILISYEVVGNPGSYFHVPGTSVGWAGMESVSAPAIKVALRNDIIGDVVRSLYSTSNLWVNGNGAPWYGIDILVDNAG